MSSKSSTQNLKQFADLEGQYELLKQLGEGAYGVVAAAKEKTSGDKVAIKRIKDAVEDKEQVLPQLPFTRAPG
jgi:serine/threonine protein kinase